MITIFPFKKNVSIVCSLVVGETILIKDWGYKMDGQHTIEDIKLGFCESGVQIKISGYPNWIDSGWATKIDA